MVSLHRDAEVVNVQKARETNPALQRLPWCAYHCATTTGTLLLPLRYTLLSNLPQSQHIFSIRISHAQYDGIQTAYNDPTKFVSAPQETDFSSFLYYRRQQVNKEALDFWRTYLDSSFMTVPPSLDGGIRQDAILMQIRGIRSPSPPPAFTDATLIMASVAAALSKAHYSQSLVLGQTVNARSLPLANIDQIIGPCLNFILCD
ncbi:uncharacterized protein ATNIH1004_001800 [Aspergillus tanneri]|uniref:Condensation domain-containing protein n=1 Tax=Aspergillus tanneri TaxID=1220188 RepID=A0A5M9N0G5_9EURO|nr:uncharacterized protein ATNIH1004_001800 [Aspergillus tanneri]KAA8652891.1 hypothetical protein ATNIH1004_001800 [Aspergillus tanneri]